MLDRVIIDHASPTLARLKLGNLFNHTIGEGFHTEFAGLYGQLQEKGVTMACLQVLRGKALIYIYRADELEKVLRDAGVQQLLAACGYSCFDVTGAVNMLRI